MEGYNSFYVYLTLVSDVLYPHSTVSNQAADIPLLSQDIRGLGLRNHHTLVDLVHFVDACQGPLWITPLYST